MTYESFYVYALTKAETEIQPDPSVSNSMECFKTNYGDENKHWWARKYVHAATVYD